VYEDIMIRVKNHHITATVRVEIDLGRRRWVGCQAPRLQYVLREDVAALAEEGAYAEPEGVRDGPDIGGRALPVLLPLVRRDSGQAEQRDG
jgi:hypothetical protein